MLSGEVDSVFSLPALITALVTYLIAATIYHSLNAPRLPRSIPWQGYGKGWIAAVRNFYAVTKNKEWLLSGYEKYSKNNKIFLLPATLGIQAEIVVPTSQMSWMFDQPDSVLSSSASHYDLLQGDYAFVEPIILRDPYHEHVMHKNLVRNLNAIIPDLADETPQAVEAVFGMDTTAYTKLETLDAFLRIIPRISNRMLVGPRLAHEPKYLDAVVGFTQDIVRTQLLMTLFPKALHPLVGPLFGLASTYHYWLSSRYTLPLIEKRLQDIRRHESGDPEYKDWVAPHDFITWTYYTATAEGRPEELRPDRIAKRVLPLNFAANHTTSITAADALGLILSAEPSVLDSLREEAHRVWREEGGWTKQGLNRMHRMDSAIRESQRVSPIASTFVARKVVAKEGVVSPEGVHIGYGTALTCPWMPVALDEDMMDAKDATVFDAFRYSRAKEAYDLMTPDEKRQADALALKQTSMVTTSHRHLPFGHGRHACPGRFFVSYELKLIFAHLLLHYDFKPLPEKPKKMWLVRYIVPLPTHFEVKRRKTVWQPE
ncbi:hypothetical protein ACEQ8H_005479 [Pleosporales sp. CAS-2024a]